jgi:hypothetical protein
MKKLMYVLILPLVVVSGLVLANRVNNKETSPKRLSIADKKAHRDDKKKWEASPDGVAYRKWEDSPTGRKVQASVGKIRKNIETFTNMEAVVTSLTIPTANGAPLGLNGVMVRINGEDYILNYVPDRPNCFFSWFNNDFQQLNNLKVNDKIIIRSRNIARAPKYSYLIISAAYIEQDGKTIFKFEPHKGDGC